MAHKGKRIYNLLDAVDLEDTYFVIDKRGWEHPRRFPLSGTCNLITDTDIITEITKKTNWVNRIYVGSEEGLSACDWYLDRVKMIMYQYDGSMLVRWGVNNVL
jgi:hypothetical protein